MDKVSNAQQIKELYKEIMEDNVEHSRVELFAYANQKSGGRYTDGMLTGALRTLVTDTADYICVRRGWYRKKNSEERDQEPNSLIETYTDIFQEALRKCNNITSDPFQVLRMKQDDLNKLGEVEKCMKYISGTIDKIR
ncbi:MAG: hypothetical protein J6C00_03275 [Eubacterium sp.]|nr:hypothetical protein [Eubacterium sp.]